MNKTMIDTCLWSIQRELMHRYGCDQAERDMWPLWWWINTGRASTPFLRALVNARPVLVARDLHKGGSYDEVVQRVERRIRCERAEV